MDVSLLKRRPYTRGMQTQKEIKEFFEISTLIPIKTQRIREFFSWSQTSIFVLRIWAQQRAHPPPSPSQSLIPRYKLPVGQAPGS